MRDGKGKWKRFPFFYTLYALIEIDLPAAKEELRFAKGLCEKYSKRKALDKFSKRKIKIAKMFLETD